ncbi:MAG: ABC transporter ATP-binding protein [Janthinobacterium lividum]
MNGVEVRGIAKSFGPTRVLDDITMGFADGGFTSLLGPSGSGKTTLLRIIGGFEAPDAGTVTIGGEDVTRTPLWRRRIGMVFQSYALFPHMTVAENVAYGLHRQGIRGTAAKAEVARALALVELEGFDARRPKQLSGGQQQRVALARAIVTKPRVLLLDEPLSALDRRLRQTMQVELRRIQRESGLTTIFVTHDQEEALTLSDRVAILDRGRIIQEGTPSEVYERPLTLFAATFLGDANLFAGTVRSGAVETPQGALRSATPLPADGTPVTLAVRPEKLLLLAPGQVAPEGLNGIDATLRLVVYAGATSTILLTMQDGTEVKAFCPSGDVPTAEPGAMLRVAWSPAHTIVLRSR